MTHPRHVYLEGTRDNMKFLASTLAFNYVQMDSEKLEDRHYALISQFLTDHCTKLDPKVTEAITKLHYDQSIAQVQVELIEFVRKVLNGELNLLLDRPLKEEAILQGEQKFDENDHNNDQEINQISALKALKEALKAIKDAAVNNTPYDDQLDRRKNLNHVVIRETIETIQRAFGLHQSFRPELSEDELRNIDAEKFKEYKRLFLQNYKKLLAPLSSGTSESDAKNAINDTITVINFEACEKLGKARSEMETLWEGVVTEMQKAKEKLVTAQTPLKNSAATVTSLGEGDEEEKSEEVSAPLKTPSPKEENRKNRKGHHILSPKDRVDLANTRLDVNARDYLDNTLLHHALVNGNRKFLTMFLMAGARLDMRNKFGQTALDIPDALEQLLKFRDDNDNNVFHLAVIHGHGSSFRLLFERVKNDENGPKLLMKRNRNGKTPLDIADKNGNQIWHLMAQELPENHKEQDQYLQFISDMVDLADPGNKPSVQSSEIKIDEIAAFNQALPSGGPTARRSLAFGTPSSQIKSAYNSTDVKADPSCLIVRNNANQNACTLVTERVKQEREELNRVKAQFKAVNKAFYQVLFYLYVQLDGLYDETDSVDYQYLIKKLQAVQDGMHRIRGGEESQIVLDNLIKRDDIREKRSWWDCRASNTVKLLNAEELRSELSKLNKVSLKGSAEQYLVNSLGRAMRNGEVDQVSSFCEDIDSENFHPYRPLFQRYSKEKPDPNESFSRLSDHSKPGVLDPKRARTPIELTAWEAVQCRRERDVLLERQGLVTRIFGLIVGHLVVSMSKCKKRSADYQLLNEKLKLVKSAVKRVLTSKQPALVAVLDGLHAEKIIQTKRNWWDFFHAPRTLVLIDRAKNELEKESAQRHHATARSPLF